MDHDQRFVWFDLIRGLCAIAVCAGHLRAAMFVDYGHAESSALTAMFYGLTGLGHQAVIVFFVLSGFFVGGTVLRSADRFHWGQYAIARLTRLWTVLIPALLMTFVIDQVIAWRTPEALRLEFMVAHGFGGNVSYSAGSETFLGNLFFVQTILTPVFGTNGPLWSLSNEFWYYVLFPLCVAALGKMPEATHGAWSMQLAFGLVSAVIFALLPFDMRSGYLAWLMGVFVYVGVGKSFIKQLHKTSIRIMLLASIVAFASTLIYSKSSLLQQHFGLPPDVMLGLGFALLCIMITQYQAPLKLVNISRVISECSYSLYLSHFPFVVLIASEFYKETRRVPDALGALQFLGWLMLLLTIAWLFWRVFESQTHLVRAMVYRKIMPNRAEVQRD